MIEYIIVGVIIYLILGFGYASYVTMKYKKDVKTLEKKEAIIRFLILVIGWLFFLFLDLLEVYLAFIVK